MLQKILVPLDGSKLAEKALPYAEALAQKFDAELILLLVLQQPMPVALDYGGIAPPYEIITDQAIAEARTYLQGLQTKFEQQHIPTRISTLESQSVADAIIDLAIQESVDVIVKTTHGRSGLSRWIFGNVAARVLQQAPCPVFLIRVRAEDMEG